jgi:3-hydroxyisobutyrate dehydrogenase-like beta-hydroxyacid dehydrogenase
MNTIQKSVTFVGTLGAALAASLMQSGKPAVARNLSKMKEDQRLSDKYYLKASRLAEAMSN